jgi:hypothetical protein
MSLPENPYGKSESLIFSSGAASSKIPRYDLIPHNALKRLVERFELGLERHKERSWNGRSSQEYLLDKEWVIARAAHAIDHAFKLLTKLHRKEPLEDDDAAAIAWAGICLCEATQEQLDYESEFSAKSKLETMVGKTETSKTVPKRNKRNKQRK